MFNRKLPNELKLIFFNTFPQLKTVKYLLALPLCDDTADDNDDDNDDCEGGDGDGGGSDGDDGLGGEG